MGEMERDCLITHGCANFIRDRFFVNSDQYSHLRTMWADSSSKYEKMTYECRTPMCVGRPAQICEVEIPYACKLLLQELASMCIQTRIYAQNMKTRDNTH
jgi:DNA-directed RNA polymerase II subunit RPB2